MSKECLKKGYNMKKWEKYSKEELQNFCNESKSYSELCKRVGYSHCSGSATASVKEMIKRFSLDVSHFKGQAWNKDNFDYSRFKYGNNIKITQALPALTALRGHVCEECGNTEWNNQQIPLEIHHKDGNHLNNSLENLILLCPNCHALTENYKGKNLGNKIKYTDEEFVNYLKESKNIRQALLKMGLTASGGNYQRAYDLIVENNIAHLLNKK